MDSAKARQVQDKFKDQFWRLNNLYWITDKAGRKVLFRMNPVQENLYWEMHYRNVILKARQKGFTTFIDLFGLDSALFNSNFNFGIIAHSLDDATAIFRHKIQFPYENLPSALRETITATVDRAGELVFSNGSTVRVSTSYRSATLQLLHVSEYGKISIKYPEKAREIKTGAFEAVGLEGMIFVESTAEGKGGEFYDLCHTAKKRKDEGIELSPLDWKFFFEPWYTEAGYRMNPVAVAVPKELQQYFDTLEHKHGIALDAAQKAWYTAKSATLAGDMKQEYPSTPEEAFEASVEGAYYAEAMAWLRRHGRITQVPHNPGAEVNTFWDLGRNDTTEIWFHQQVGREHFIINHFAGSGEAIAYYANYLKERAKEDGYVYGKHYMPHDSRNTELFGDGRTRIEVAEDLGIKPVVPIRRAKGPEELADDIETTRNFLKSCWIDKAKCSKGIDALDNYRKEWDENRGTWKSSPLHNWASNGADSMRTGAVGLKIEKPEEFIPTKDLCPPAEAYY